MWKQCGFFNHRNYIEESTWEQRGFFEQQNYTDKGVWKQRVFFHHQNYIEKVRGNDREIGPNLVFDVSTKYPSRIDVDSTWCALWGAFRRFRIHANTLRKTQKKINKKNIIIKNALQVDLAKFVVDQGNGVIRQIFT